MAKKTTLKKNAKQSAANQRKGGRYVKSAYNKAKKSEKKGSKSMLGGDLNRKKDVKAQTLGQTSANLLSEGKKSLASGTKPKKRSSLTVTPRSAAKREMQRNPVMQPKKGVTRAQLRKRNSTARKRK